LVGNRISWREGKEKKRGNERGNQEFSLQTGERKEGKRGEK